MIRAVMSRGERGPLLLLGLSAGNVRRLTEGQPILVELDALLGVHGELAIHYGETLGAIADELAQAGWPLPPDERERIAELDADETAR